MESHVVAHEFTEMYVLMFENSWLNYPRSRLSKPGLLHQAVPHEVSTPWSAAGASRSQSREADGCLGNLYPKESIGAVNMACAANHDEICVR